MKKPTEAGSLQDFAKTDRRAYGQCWACHLPETAEINAGRVAGVPIATIHRWLEKRGHKDATRNKLGHHFQGGHHLKRKAS